MVFTRLNISHVVGGVSYFLTNLEKKKKHNKVVNWILMYKW